MPVRDGLLELKALRYADVEAAKCRPLLARGDIDASHFAQMLMFILAWRRSALLACLANWQDC
jgi:hypothetical protein